MEAVTMLLNDTSLTDDYWIQYLKEKYFVNQIPEGKTAKEVAALAGRILQHMFASELYPTFRVLEFAIMNLPEAQIFECIENWTSQQFFGVYCFHEEITHTLKKKFPRIPGVTDPVILPEGNSTSEMNLFNLTFHVVFSSFEKKYWKKILDIILVPTVYLTPKGPVTINFDRDRYDVLGYEEAGVTPDMAHFREYLENNVSVYQRMLFMQHFTEF